MSRPPSTSMRMALNNLTALGDNVCCLSCEKSDDKILLLRLSLSKKEVCGLHIKWGGGLEASSSWDLVLSGDFSMKLLTLLCRGIENSVVLAMKRMKRKWKEETMSVSSGFSFNPVSISEAVFVWGWVAPLWVRTWESPAERYSRP